VPSSCSIIGGRGSRNGVVSGGKMREEEGTSKEEHVGVDGFSLDGIDGFFFDGRIGRRDARKRVLSLMAATEPNNKQPTVKINGNTGIRRTTRNDTMRGVIHRNNKIGKREVTAGVVCKKTTTL
jgi:hypothetical protein